VDGKTWMDFVSPEDVVISVLAGSPQDLRAIGFLSSVVLILSVECGAWRPSDGVYGWQPKRQVIRR
jgi:hypothetical protein